MTNNSLSGRGYLLCWGPAAEFRYPCIVEDDPIYPMQHLSHFELYYVQASHYDPVVSCETGQVSSKPPPLR